MNTLNVRHLATALAASCLFAGSLCADAGGKGLSANQLLAAELETLYSLTAHHQRIENAHKEGWNVPIGTCMDNPPVGGMGFHFGHLENYLDGQAILTRPEVLVYEPTAAGSLRLVAVEYTVPLFLWPGDDPPRLFGRDFHLSPGGEDWILHVWLYKTNPRGMFEDWNPNVSCEFAS